MNEWIERKTDPTPHKSKLPVLPPEPAGPSPEKRPPPVEDSKPLSTRRSLAAASLPIARSVSPTKPSVPQSSNVTGPLRPPTQAIDDESAEGVLYDTVVFDPLNGFVSTDVQYGFGQFDVFSREKPKKKLLLPFFSNFSFVYGVPSWLTSFIVHLVLIIVLALFSIVAKQGPNIEFVLSDQPSAADLDFMEVAVDLNPAVEENKENLQQPDPANLFSDLDMLEANLSQDLDQLSDSTELIDPLTPLNIDFERGDGKGASFFGTGALGTRFVFVVDCSGSMGDEYRWIMARRELKEALLGLTAKQEFYVFLYNNTSFSFTRRKPEMMSATKKNMEKIFKWLDKQHPIGDTRPWNAMRSSLRMKPDAIFLLSDGELKDDTVPRLVRENREKMKKDVKIGKVPVHTISLGSGYGSATMRKIAEENNGTFTHVNTW